jgi:hypothetical protein
MKDGERKQKRNSDMGVGGEKLIVRERERESRQAIQVIRARQQDK